MNFISEVDLKGRKLDLKRNKLDLKRSKFDLFILNLLGHKHENTLNY